MHSSISQRGASIAAILALACTLAACSKEPLSVHILPNEYRVGDVKSALATPVVDEAVRLEPRAVHLLVCLGTPPAKAVQLQTELAARFKGPMTLSFLEAGQCPA
jgi:hypothetical protein